MKSSHHTRIATNQKGQGAVEAVLLMAIIATGTLVFSQVVQEKQFLQKLIAQPWNTLSGMIECGTWERCQPGYHPNNLDRAISYKPTE